MLSVKQALILKTFGVAAAEFRVKMLAYHDGESSKVTEVDGKKKQTKAAPVKAEDKE